MGEVLPTVRRASRLSFFAWGVLTYSLAVVVWGAYVRATGSGAGCGSHWPTCHGEVIPREPSVATLVEYTHRVTSGLAFLMVAWLLRVVLRARPKGHVARRMAVLAMLFMVMEAAVGAGLVLFELVAQDRSPARGAFMAVHLLNTFFLLACLALTAWHADDDGPAHHRGPKVTPSTGLRMLLGGLASLLLLGVSGAIAALGDTLFPAVSVAEGLNDELSPTAHVFVRLRLLHPFLAVLSSGLLVGAVLIIGPRYRTQKALARALMTLLCAQLSLGALDVLLLAPVWLQLLHLLGADLVWVVAVLLTSEEMERLRKTRALASAEECKR
jgi:heme A synthase